MENVENGVSSTPIRRRTAMPSTATVPPQQAPNGMRANSASTMPIRRRVEPTTSNVGTPMPVNSKVNEGFHNPKILSIILSCLSVVGLICFFLLPIYKGETELLGDVNFKFMSFVSGQAPFKVASSLMLVGYSIVLFNSLLNFWHEKKVVFKKIFWVQLCLSCC